MELLHMEPAAIWRLLIPSRHWLFADQLADNQLIFVYRDKIYFVHEEGSVVAFPKPGKVESLTLPDLLYVLSAAEDVIDFDDEGVFDYASILEQMGYVVPAADRKHMGSFLVEIVNTLDPAAQVTRYRLTGVTFSFALYDALKRCRELNERCDGEFEHEILRICAEEGTEEQTLSLFH